MNNVHALKVRKVWLNFQSSKERFISDLDVKLIFFLYTHAQQE